MLRPALDEVLNLLQEGDTVLVARFFRLGRSHDHVIYLVHSFHERDIHFKALDLGIDTTTPAGKFILAIFAALAEYDRERAFWRRRKLASRWRLRRASTLANRRG